MCVLFVCVEVWRIELAICAGLRIGHVLAALGWFSQLKRPGDLGQYSASTRYVPDSTKRSIVASPHV